MQSAVLENDPALSLDSFPVLSFSLADLRLPEQGD